MRKPRPLSLVTYKREPITPYPEQNSVFVFLGETPNMPGHCAVSIVKSNGDLAFEEGQIYVGFHTDSLRELTEAEV